MTVEVSSHNQWWCRVLSELIWNPFGREAVPNPSYPSIQGVILNCDVLAKLHSLKILHVRKWVIANLNRFVAPSLCPYLNY